MSADLPPLPEPLTWLTSEQYNRAYEYAESVAAPLRQKIAELENERDALAAAMPSEGADAALAYAVEKARAAKAEQRIAELECQCQVLVNGARLVAKHALPYLRRQAAEHPSHNFGEALMEAEAEAKRGHDDYSIAWMTDMKQRREKAEQALVEARRVPPEAELDALAARLELMGDSHRRHDYDIGDYWNAVDECAVAIQRLRAQQYEARTSMLNLKLDLQRIVEWEKPINGSPEIKALQERDAEWHKQFDELRAQLEEAKVEARQAQAETNIFMAEIETWRAKLAEQCGKTLAAQAQLEEARKNERRWLLARRLLAPHIVGALAVEGKPLPMPTPETADAIVDAALAKEQP